MLALVPEHIYYYGRDFLQTYNKVSWPTKGKPDPPARPRRQDPPRKGGRRHDDPSMWRVPSGAHFHRRAMYLPYGPSAINIGRGGGSGRIEPSRGEIIGAVLLLATTTHIRPLSISTSSSTTGLPTDKTEISISGYLEVLSTCKVPTLRVTCHAWVQYRTLPEGMAQVRARRNG